MALEALPSDPRLSRSHLLSQLPARMQPINFEKLRAPFKVEQGTMMEEHYMMEDAADASLMSYFREQGRRMDKHGRVHDPGRREEKHPHRGGKVKKSQTWKTQLSTFTFSSEKYSSEKYSSERDSHPSNVVTTLAKTGQNL